MQPAVLYARKAPVYGINTYYPPSDFSYRQEYALHLNYLLVPINLLYSQRPNGRGGQVFAGPYLGWLLDGTYTSTTSNSLSTAGNAFTGNIKTSDTYSTAPMDTNYPFRQIDAGVQVGMGYGFAALQVQASFSLGLRDISPAYAPDVAHDYAAPAIHNRGFQLSAAYMFGSKK